MQPIIRRTITITIVETWTITWPDGSETSWEEKKEVRSPSGHEPRLLYTDDEASKDSAPDPDAAESGR